MRRLVVTLVAAAVGLAVVLQATAALAHAALVKAEPADGAVVATAPSVLRLTFNEPVSPLAVRLFGPDGAAVPLGDVAAANSVVAIPVPLLQTGTHVLSWRVISADGHPVGGSLVFSVGAPSAQPLGAQPPADPAVAVAMWAAKLALYLGIAIGIGGAFFRAWIAPVRADDPALPRGRDATAEAEPFIVTALIVGLAAAALSVSLQGLDALELPLGQIGRGAAWETGLATSYGLTAIVLAFALFGAVFSCAAPSRPARRAFALAALAGAGIALSLSGHASNAAPQWANRPAVFVHGVCMAFWIGALLPLWFSLRNREGDAALARFSAIVPVPLALLAASGLWLATVQLREFGALWTTDYGRVLTAKLVAVAALLGLAAANRYRLVPAFHVHDAAAAHGVALHDAAVHDAAASRLRRSIALELVIAATILALVAVWRFTPPPRALAVPDTISVHLHGDKAMAQIEMARDREGHGSAQIQVLDGGFRPLAAKEVTLLLANPSAGLEPIRRAGVRTADDLWRVDDVRVPIAGRWTVQVEVLINDFEQTTVSDTVQLPRFP